MGTINSMQDRSKVHFQQGDACNLDPNLGQFGCVLAANLICRLPEPMSFLEALPRLVVPGGIVVITSPYTWMKDYTPEVCCVIIHIPMCSFSSKMH